MRAISLAMILKSLAAMASTKGDLETLVSAELDAGLEPNPPHRTTAARPAKMEPSD